MFLGRTIKTVDALDTIKALTRHMDILEVRNQEQYEATQLQLATISSMLQTVTHALSQLDNRLVSSQCVILFQSMEIGYHCNLSNIRANEMTLKTQLLVGMELEKAAVVHTMLAEFDKEEVALLSKINQANRDFLTIIRGHVSQLHPISSPSPVHLSMPTVPPGLFNAGRMDGLATLSNVCFPSKRSDDRHVFSSKRCCVSNDDSEEKEMVSLATGSLMKVDLPNPQAKEVGEVHPLPLLSQDMPMVIHVGASIPSSNVSKKPLPKSTGTF